MPTATPPPTSPNDPGADSPTEAGGVLSEISFDKPATEPSRTRHSRKSDQREKPSSANRSGGLSWLSWATLLLPLAGLLWLAASFDRGAWPSLVGDEAVYLMAAQSLAWDGDFRYTEVDLHRFEELLGRTPDGLILQSPDGGKTMFYGKSWLYPVAIAPFVKAMPQNGYAVGNAVYLLLAACAAAWALGAVLGRAAPLFVSAFIFGSITFAHVFWAHSDLLLMSLVAIGCALILQPWLLNSRPLRLSLDQPPAPARNALRGPLRLTALAVGSVLLTAVVITRPYYAPLLLIPIIATSTRRRGQWKHLLFATSVVAACLTAFVAINISTTGEWSPYAGHREAFYSYTGFPKTDFPKTGSPETETPRQPSTAPHPAWTVEPGEEGDNSWTGSRLFAFPFEPHQFAWNTAYLFLGRHTGLIPYFLPFLLGLFAFRSDRVSWYLVLSLAAISILFLYTRPFNYYGGGGALANRYFLPIYPLSWFLVRRNISWRWPLLLTALSFFTLYPKWTDASSFWRDQDGAFTHVSKVSARYLPYETTQSTLKPAATEDINYQTPYGKQLWLKPLSPRIRTPDQGKTLTLAPGPTRAEVVVATEKPQRAFRIEIRGQAPHTARFNRPSARHRMWWTFEPLYLYRFSLESDAAQSTTTQPVTITPIPKYRPQR